MNPPAPATATATETTAYSELLGLLKDARLLESCNHLVSWDQETLMPPKGAARRAEMLSTIAGLGHEKATNPRIGELIEACRGEFAQGTVEAANLREIERDYEKATKLPGELIREMSRCSSLGMEAWKEARQKSDFKVFAPWLTKTVELSREKAKCLGIPEGGEIYDALMDAYEPGMTAQRTTEIFTPLRAFTVELLAEVMAATKAGKAPDVEPAERVLPIEKQKVFCERVLRAMGFDFDAGRLDQSTHPFCSGITPGDCRLTNRYRDNGWCDALSSGTHEGGHGMYEQGLNGEWYGTPLGDSVSLGIHESQSRMWENLVGRSEQFWEWALPVAKEVFGADFGAMTVEQIHRANNVIRPSFIRVESDELTYNLHIMLRFDFERKMLNGDLAINDLPSAWNERMKADFGLTVDKDAKGCLQDVHWSMGAMGYFPTYTFGNLYSAQLWNAMGKALPKREEQMRSGEFAPILGWLRENIHQHGRRYAAEDLCEMATGERLNPQYLMDYLRGKANRVYGV